MNINNMHDLVMDYKKPLLKKLFRHIKQSNYYLDHQTDVDIRMQLDLIDVIENYFLKNDNLEYIYTVNSAIPLLETKKIKNKKNNLEYYQRSHKVYFELQPELQKFIYLNSNKKLHQDTAYDHNQKMDFFLHSADLVLDEIQILKDLQPSLYEEIEEYLIDFKIAIESEDAHQIKKSGLHGYIDVLKKSDTNYVLESKNQKLFYPIIVDILLDYAYIMDLLNTYEKDLKNIKKRYHEFRKQLASEEHTINPLFFHFAMFSKEERITNIKRYLLQSYLVSFNNNKNINTLFRKLFLKNLRDRKDYKPSDMKDYKTGTHLIFNILNNFQYFL